MYFDKYVPHLLKEMFFAVLDSLVERAVVEGLVAEALLLMWMWMWVLLVFLLAEDLQLQEELLLLQETCIRRVHLWRRRFLCLLVRRDVLVVLQLLYFRLDVFGFLVAVLLRHFGLQRNGTTSWNELILDLCECFRGLHYNNLLSSVLCLVIWNGRDV